jgi:hypothetical protein
MKLLHHIVVTGMLSLGFTAQVESTAQTNLESEVRMDQATPAFPGVHDFDFVIGRWQVHHRRLKERSIWWLDISATGATDKPVRICWERSLS